MKTEQDYFKPYENLIGFTPPKIKDRVRVGLEVDPDLLHLVETVRQQAMFPKCFDVKTSQLVLFAVMLSQVLPGAEFHARAARRAGATKEELHATAALVFLFRGLPAFNLGAKVIREVFDDIPDVAPLTEKAGAAVSP